MKLSEDYRSLSQYNNVINRSNVFIYFQIYLMCNLYMYQFKLLLIGC